MDGSGLAAAHLNRWREGGMQFGVCNFFCASYAFRGGTNLHVHTLSLNLHTVPNPKRVLKTELGTQNFLPAEMTSNPAGALC